MLRESGNLVVQGSTPLAERQYNRSGGIEVVQNTAPNTLNQFYPNALNSGRNQYQHPDQQLQNQQSTFNSNPASHTQYNQYGNFQNNR